MDSVKFVEGRAPSPIGIPGSTRPYLLLALLAAGSARLQAGMNRATYVILSILRILKETLENLPI
jgi:hypothetical protein